MLPYTRNLHQDAVYWPPLGNDGFGGFSYGEPVAIKCRWQSRVTLVRNAQGKEVPSSAIVYPDRELRVEGLLLPGTIPLGGFTAPPANARQILSAGSSPSLRATVELHKVWLQ